jgi:hypothetical protein
MRVNTVGSAMASEDRSQYAEGYAFAAAELVRLDLAWAVIDYFLAHPIADDWDRGALDAAVEIVYGRTVAGNRLRLIRPRRPGPRPWLALSHRQKAAS